MAILRNMAGFYLLDGDYILLLYRIGSKVISQPLWRNIGGHMESWEINNPLACALRELEEEAGITPDLIDKIRLKYVTLRYVKGEIRQNYNYFADYHGGHYSTPHESREGIFEWVHIDELFSRPMPLSSKSCLAHYFVTGQHDNLVYALVSTDVGDHRYYEQVELTATDQD